MSMIIVILKKTNLILLVLITMLQYFTLHWISSSVQYNYFLPNAIRAGNNI